MRFPRTPHLASRAFSLGMRATAAARPPVMVPLSLLQDQAARFDREAQRFDVAVAQATAQAARQEKREAQLMAQATVQAAREEKHIKLLEEASAYKLATALFERDVARGKVTARALIEEAVAETWRALERLDAEERERVSPSPKGAAVKKPPSTVTDKLQAMLRFPAVAAYLQVAEEDNGLARGVLAKSAAIVYPAVCTPLHGRAAGEQAVRLPAEVFTAIGENGRIAFAALVAFGGRNVGMYQPCGATVSVVLRVPPTLGLSATLAHIRGSARLPAVGASVELGVAAGGGA
jgi:hypothetical protein